MKPTLNKLGYLDFLNQRLRIVNDNKLPFFVADLFAGCGGLALGFESAGFTTRGYEILSDPCDTYNKNLSGTCHEVTISPGISLDPQPDVIIGGPPCQPFSVIGDQGGNKDLRNGFPAFLDLVHRYEPKIAIFENVRGMLYRSKSYLDHIISELRASHYIVEYKILHSNRYGVPQNRERLFVVAHRGVWKYPISIVNPFYTSGDALVGLHDVIPPNAKFLTKSMDAYIERYEKKSKCINPRDLDLQKPSRTVTCRNLGGSTADMLRLRLPDGRRRRLTLREGARLQSFPDWFEFIGSESSQYDQVGNAVPPLLARALADSVVEYLSAGHEYSISEIDYINKNVTKQLAFSLAINEPMLDCIK